MFRPVGTSLLLIALTVPAAPAVASPEPPKEPAKISIAVEPAGVAPGGKARVIVRLDPIDGVKINRYPNVKLQVPASAGLVAAAEGRIGTDVPPPPGEKAGYFEQVDPLTLELQLDADAPSGRHEVEGRLNYFYCMPDKGFCAPKRLPLRIPLTVR